MIDPQVREVALDISGIHERYGGSSVNANFMHGPLWLVDSTCSIGRSLSLMEAIIKVHPLDVVGLLL